MNLKSKSKINLFIVILSSLLFLSLVFNFTGAWFTSSTSSTTNPSSSFTFQLGTFGDVAINVNDYVWKDSSNKNIYQTEQAKTAANDNQGIVRTYLMPGDYLACGSVDLCYDSPATANESLVYYLIKVGNAYYTISNNQLATATTNAALINAGTANKLTINGSIISFAYDNVSYSFDGSTSSQSISDVYFQGKTLTQLGASYGNMSIAVGSEVYKVAVIQSANMSATNAFGLLQDILDDMAWFIINPYISKLIKIKKQLNFELFFLWTSTEFKNGFIKKKCQGKTALGTKIWQKLFKNSKKTAKNQQKIGNFSKFFWHKSLIVLFLCVKMELKSIWLNYELIKLLCRRNLWTI